MLIYLILCLSQNDKAGNHSKGSQNEKVGGQSKGKGKSGKFVLKTAKGTRDYGPMEMAYRREVTRSHRLYQDS
ncbi:Histidine--tRNA ligase [Portunus trituberculatus]|uniref:Histidine--tRNA ligase n=1 Tax=Portunus trituberculatus TaxID=210409 RepID=A0A5B7JME6_PORTR|nr:Histidine--tRNA ligase [Portunus trituberculatus]